MLSPSAENLFRRQAIDALSRRPFGRPIALFPRPWFWLTLLIAVLATAVAGFLATAEYSRKESVRGWLVARDGITRVSHDASARVIAQVRSPGDYVAAGEPIMVLGRHRFLEDGSESHATQVREFKEQEANIARQMQMARTEAAIEVESINAQLALLDAELQSAGDIQRQQQQRIATAAGKLSRLEIAAASGAATDWELIREQDELSGLQLALMTNRQQTKALQRERQRLQERATRLPLDTEKELAGLALQRSDLQQQLTRQRAAHRVVIVAPVSGKLASIVVNAGDSVEPRQLLATIVPQELSLRAEVYVPSSAIGFVRPGQAVRLLYDAFPYQRFGTFSGQVARVSDFVFLPDEIPKAFQLREAAFKVTIDVDQANLEGATGGVKLRPGMLLVADIVLETRTLATWLLAPLRWQGRATRRA